MVVTSLVGGEEGRNTRVKNSLRCTWYDIMYEVRNARKEKNNEQNDARVATGKILERRK